MSNVFLKINNGFSWHSNEHVFVKGCFYDSENNLYQDAQLISYFEDVHHLEDFIKKVQSINGIFTIVVKRGQELFVACDTTRIFPLFYSLDQKELVLSDDIDFLKEELHLNDFDKLAIAEFKSAGYTMSSRTLLKGIYQTQSNQYIHFKGNKIERKGFFFNYSIEAFSTASYKKLRQKGIEVIDRAFTRLIKSLNNRHVVVPLSGGYDSRLIVVMLKKFNYKNVTCYTYGKKGNYEIENSKNTAHKLGYDWFFIEYTEELMANYITTESFKKFVHYSCKYSSLPSLQDYFSVKYLSDQKLIPKNAIFVPGYAGDFLGGSQYTKVISSRLTIKNLPKQLLQKKFFYNKTSNSSKKMICNAIQKNLKAFDANFNTKIPSTVFEDFDLKEKLTKFIFKAAHLYTFFGYEHRFPFWDMELLHFFKYVPKEYKIAKVLYDDILKNHYFAQFDVNFESELQPSLVRLKIQYIKERIKPYLPQFVRNRYLEKNDWLNFKHITDQMRSSMSQNNLEYNSQVSLFNEYNIQWMLYYAMDQIQTKDET